jgi:hypothetical protein
MATLNNQRVPFVDDVPIRNDGFIAILKYQRIDSGRCGCRPAKSR